MLTRLIYASVWLHLATLPLYAEVARELWGMWDVVSVCVAAVGYHTAHALLAYKWYAYRVKHG